MYIIKRWYYGRGAPPVNWLVLAVCIRNEHVYAVMHQYPCGTVHVVPFIWVQMRVWTSYRRVCIGHGYRRYTATGGCLNGTAKLIIGHDTV